MIVTDETRTQTNIIIGTHWNVCSSLPGQHNFTIQSTQLLEISHENITLAPTQPQHNNQSVTILLRDYNIRGSGIHAGNPRLAAYLVHQRGAERRVDANVD